VHVVSRIPSRRAVVVIGLSRATGMSLVKIRRHLCFACAVRWVLGTPEGRPRDRGLRHRKSHP